MAEHDTCDMARLRSAGQSPWRHTWLVWLALSVAGCDGPAMENGRERLIGMATRAADAVRGGVAGLRASSPGTAELGGEAMAPRPPAPALRGTSATGEAFDITELRGRPIVLVFYRGASCGLCRRRLEALQENLAAYAPFDALVVGVSPDQRDDAAALRAELGLTFDLITVDRPTLESWGIWPAGERAPRPAAAIIGPDGSIAYSHVGTNAADRVPDLELIAALEAMSPTAPASERARRGSDRL